MASLFEKLIEDIQDHHETVFSVIEMTNAGIQSKDLVPAPATRYSYSISKGFTATAVGMLELVGVLSDEDLIYPLFEDLFPANHDIKWETVKIKDVLHHRSGLAKPMFSVDCDDFSEYQTDDFLKIMFAEKLDNEVGKEMTYIDGHYYLLSRVVEKKTGMTLYQFLLENLFNPMHFQGQAWATCPQGHTMGGSGLSVRTQDMIKMGWMYLNNGVYEGKRYLSEEWVKKAMDTIPVDQFGDYGYAIQRKAGSNGDCYFSGAFGQLINIMPRTHRVIALHSYTSNILRIIDNLRIWEDEELQQQ